MNATGKRRLLKLADFLSALKLKRGQFKMADWATSIVNGAPECGTAACAAGWAARIPSFRRAGYHLVVNRNPGLFGQRFVPAIGRKRSVDALQFLFDISSEDCMHLFGGHNPNSAKRTAQRIRGFVKKAA